MTKSCKIITLHVQIEDIKPPIWRRIAVDGEISLRLLHHILQVAFGWTDLHGYEAFVDTILNRRDSDEGLECLEWVGGDFDPESFDRRTADNTLARIAWNGWGK
jgi:hypothetical protein